jgi:hypothetical protein
MVLALAILIRFGWIAINYSPDFARFQSGDYRLYEIGGEHILQHGDFSNSLFLVRPPLFPLLIAFLGLNTSAVLVVNALVGALLAPLTLFLALRIGLQPRLALIAGVIAAVDPPSVIYSAYLGTEALANTFLAAAVCAFLIGVTSAKRTVMWGIASGILLVLATYTRPSSYLLWIPLGIGVLLFARKYARFAIAFMIVSGVGIGLWIVHNGVVFGNPTFSTIGVYNLLYYRAASVEHLATNQDLDTVYTELSTRVEALLGRDTSLVDAGTRHGHYAATAALQDAMQSVAINVFISHPLEYLVGIPIGLMRILILIEGVPNWAVAVVALWNTSLLALTLVGLELARRTRKYRELGTAVLIFAYYILGTIVVQTSGIDVRARTVLIPVLASAAAFALSKWCGSTERR